MKIKGKALDSKKKLQPAQLVSKLNQSEKKLRASEKKYMDLLAHLPVGVYHTTPNGKLIKANQELANLLGYEHCSQLLNMHVNQFYVDTKDRDEHLKKLDTSFTSCAEFYLKRKDGKIICGRDYPRAVLDKNGEIIFYAGILVDITEQKQVEENLHKALKELERSNQERQEMIKQLENLSLTDDLTGLYNRRGFFTAGKERLKLAQRSRQKLLFLFIDLDNLKWINDSFGHQKGDLAIEKFADILNKTLRKSDIKGRLGGDEFGVVAEEASENVPSLLERRLADEIKAFKAQHDQPFQISVSLGISYYNPEHPSTIDELMIRADKLMYAQKRIKHI